MALTLPILRSISREIEPLLDGLRPAVQGFITQLLSRHRSMESAPRRRRKAARSMLQKTRRQLESLKRRIPEIRESLLDAAGQVRASHLNPSSTILLELAGASDPVLRVLSARGIADPGAYIEAAGDALKLAAEQIDGELRLIESKALEQIQLSDLESARSAELYYVLDRIFRAPKPYGLRLKTRESHRRIVGIVAKLKISSPHFDDDLGHSSAIEKAIQRLESGMKKTLDERLYENLKIPPPIV